MVAIVQNRDQKASHFTAMQTALIPARIFQSAKAAFFPSSRRSQCNERGREKCHCVSFSFLLSLCVSPCRVVDVDDDKAGGGKRENTRYMLSQTGEREKTQRMVAACVQYYRGGGEESVALFTILLSLTVHELRRGHVQ